MNNEIENIISHIKPEEDSEKMENYVNELEQQLKDMETGSYEIGMLFKLEQQENIKFEQQKAELIRILDVAVDLLSDCNYNFTLGKETLEKYK